MHTDNGKTAIINMSMCQEDIDTVARLPYSLVISDSIYADTDTPHPRMYGAFPKMIREYVRERHVLTLEQAIAKMTLMPAQRMKIKDRGILAPGAFADVLRLGAERFGIQHILVVFETFQTVIVAFKTHFAVDFVHFFVAVLSLQHTVCGQIHKNTPLQKSATPRPEGQGVGKIRI